MNVGARSVQTGQNFPSKAALKRAIKDSPQDVEFYPTSIFNAPESIRAGEMTVFSEPVYVVGPDPETSRKFYASVQVKEVKGYPRIIVG